MALALALASPAGAHAELLRADPPPGASLAGSPARIRVVFTEEVNPLSRLSLIGPGGARVLIGPTRVIGRTLQAAVGPLRPGTYVVRWGIISDEDGHLVAGTYRFRVGEGRLSEGRGGLGFRDIVTRAGPRLLLLGGALLWSGGALLALVVVSPAAEGGLGAVAPFRRRLRRAAAAAAAAALLGEVLTLVVASNTGLPVWTRAFLLGSGAGRLAVARLGILVVSIFASARLSWQRWDLPIHVGLASAYLALLATSGHASLAPAGPVSGPLTDTIHLLAGAAWLGGNTLLGLALVTRRTRMDASAVAALVRRFSPMALGAAATLAVTGAIATEQQTQSPSDFAATLYGRLLIAKLTLVGLLLATSAWVGFRLRPALVRAPPDTPEAARRASRLLAKLRLESPLALGIIVCVALMTSLASPRAVVAGRTSENGRPPAPAPVLARGQAGAHPLSLSILPGARGRNTVIISVEGTRPDRVRLRFDRLGLAGVDVSVAGEGGLYTSDVDFPSGGEWRATVTTTSGRAAFTFPIGDRAAAENAVEVLSVADLRGPARDRCRDEAVGQQVAFAREPRPPVFRLLLERGALPRVGVPGSPAVLLGVCGTPGEELRRLSEGLRLPALLPEGARPGPWSWSIGPEPETEGRALARIGFDVIRGRSALIVHEGAGRFAREARAFAARFSSSGGTTTVLELRSPDVVGTAARLAAIPARPDLLVLVGSPESIAPLARALDRRGWRPTKLVLAGSALFGPEILDAAPDWRDKGLITIASYSELDVRLVSAYVTGLLEAFPGEPPTIRGLQGFINARLLLDALEGLGPAPSSAEVRRALDGTFRNGWAPARIDIAWGPENHAGARQIALFQLTPALDIFSLLGHRGHEIGGLLYRAGDLQRYSSFYGETGDPRPETPHAPSAG